MHVFSLLPDAFMHEFSPLPYASMHVFSPLPVCIGIFSYSVSFANRVGPAQVGFARTT